MRIRQKFPGPVRLATHDDARQLEMRDLDFRGFDSSADTVTCMLRVRSHSLSAEQAFTFYRVKQTINDLEKMRDGHPGRAVFAATPDESCLEMTLTSLGQLHVTGTLVEDGDDEQRLELAFITDRTALDEPVEGLSQAWWKATF